MKRLVLLIATLALTLAGPAAAKGPDQATITGPGLEGGKIVFRSGGGDPEAGTEFMRFVEAIGFFRTIFRPLVVERPTGKLGPRYKVVYRVPGPDGDNATIRQDLYPYSSLGVVSYTKPGQKFFSGSEKTRGGWFVAGHAAKRTLAGVGFPGSAPTGGGSWFDPVTGNWLVTFVVVLLLGISGALVLRRGPRFRPAS